MKKAILIAVAAVLAWSTAVYSQDRVIEMLRADLRAERTAMVEEEMQFTPQEAAVFWPVYQKYENEIRKLNDQRIELIHTYADNYTNITDDIAEQLAKKSLELDIKEAYLRKQYFREFNHVLPATRAAKFFQLDNFINLVVKTQIAEELPFIE
jgi:methanogenic corrinoid protein MtbC1